MVTTYRVSVYETRIVSLMQTGEGARWGRDVAKRIEGAARIRAPRRSGRLASSHVTLTARGTNQYQKVYRVSALAPYASYVHGGTGLYGPARRIITRRGGRRMGPLPPRAGSSRYGRGYPRYIDFSRGQRAQPWLQQAADAVLPTV